MTILVILVKSCELKKVVEGSIFQSLPMIPNDVSNLLGSSKNVEVSALRNS